MQINGRLQVKRDVYHVVYKDPITFNYKWKSTGIKFGRTKKEQKESLEDATLAKIEIIRQLEEEYDNKKLLKDNKLFTEYLLDWLEHEKNYIKYSTYEGYLKIVNGKLIPHFESNRYVLSDITPKIIENYLIFLKERGSVKTGNGLKKKSVKNVLSVLNAAFKSAVDNGLIESNPAEKAKLPRFDAIKTDETPNVYSPDQVKKLLSQANNEDNFVKLFIYLDIITGARKGEILGLLWDDIDFESKSMQIRRNRIATDKENLELLTTPKTKNSVRIIFLPDFLVEMLCDERKRQQSNRELYANKYVEYDNDFVIRLDNGVIPYPSSVTRAVKSAMKRAGLPVIRVHDIRHTAATMLFNVASVKEVSVLLGHSTTKITEEIYIHRENICRKEITEAIADQLGL